MGIGLKRLPALLVGVAAVGALLSAPVGGQLLPDPPTRPLNEKAKGYAVHVAGDVLSPKAYGGREVPALPSARKDLEGVQKLSEGAGYQPVAVLVGKPNKDKGEKLATRDNVLQALKGVSEKASGANEDIVLVTFSGHGALVADEADDSDEVDNLEHAWCLHDGMLVDDELTAALARFQSGVRVVLVVDCDYGGTGVKGEQLSAKNFTDFRLARAKRPDATAEAIIADVPSLKYKFGDRKGRPSGGPSVRGTDPLVCLLAYADNEKFYRGVTSEHNKNLAVRDARMLAPVVVALSACRKDQIALDLGTHGLFTRELLAVWDGGKFKGDYREFQTAVKRRVSAVAADLKNAGGGGIQQQPEITVWGGAPPGENKRNAKWALSFEGQQVFRVK